MRCAISLALLFAGGCPAGSGSSMTESSSNSSAMPVEARAELWIGGDVHLGDDVAPRFAPIVPALQGAAGIVNLEGPVGTAAPAGEGVRLHNAPATLAMLKDAGVRAVGIANNHSGDLGTEGPTNSSSALREAGFTPAGLDAGAAVFESGGKRVVVTAHDLTANAGSPELASELAAARAKSDVLVSTFHVSGPASYVPRPELRLAVDQALAAGARVVAAHGTHALGPVERRGDAVIAWGLGNLTFSCHCTEEVDGAVLRVSIADDRVDARIIPIDAGLHGAAVRPSHDPSLILDLFDAIGSSPITRERGPVPFASF